MSPPDNSSWREKHEQEVDEKYQKRLIFNKQFKDLVESLPPPGSAEALPKEATKSDSVNYRFAHRMLTLMVGKHETDTAGFLILRDALKSNLTLPTLDKLEKLTAMTKLDTGYAKVLQKISDHDTSPW